MNAYRVQVFDTCGFSDSLIDNMIVIAPSFEAAIEKTRKHAKKCNWINWEIRDVVKFKETVIR